MKLLLIDTCGASGSIALADPDLMPEIVARESLPGRTASERLVGAIKQLMLIPGHSLDTLTAIAVVHGPGSFTGLRVGLSAAKGLCEALGIPLVAISRLAVLAGVAGDADGRTHTVLDAGRGEFYYGEYLKGVCLREGMLTREQVVAAVEEAEANLNPGAVAMRTQVVVVCEAAVAEALHELSPRLVVEPAAESALPLAFGRIREGAFDDIALLDANYLRRTDAELFARPTPAVTKPAIAP